MKRLMLLLLTGLLLAGCAPSPAPTETTAPETTAAPQTTTPLVTTLPPDPLDVLLDSMSPAQKVGQLFIAAPEQLLPNAGSVSALSDALGEALARYPLGGIILFGDNILSPDQLLSFTQALQDACDIPLFLAVDEEGGPVARLAGNPLFQLPTYRNAAAVGASGNPEDALSMGRTIGAYLAEYGFNLNFAPVADVNTNPANPVIGTRAFSSDPAVAAQMTAAFAQGLTENGIIATFKHFPGHGDTAQDSHSRLAVSNKTRNELESCEFLPFREATEADMVMIGHIALPNVTGNTTPATFSRRIVTEILRDELGFRGLIVTDSMQMGAITESHTPGDAALAALAAGCDIILMPENLPEAFGAVMDALEDGTLNMQWLNETVRRILQFKQRHGILNI